jgi:hypothetical protein
VSNYSGYSAHDLFEVCIAWTSITIGSNMVIENASVTDSNKKTAAISAGRASTESLRNNIRSDNPICCAIDNG